MKLHRLTFAGIGPFRQQQEIEFEAVTASGIFLIDGPTGSGKSTLVDAIVFALYDGVAGTESESSRLTSHHLGVGEEPFVELTFETHKGAYRMRRTPRHTRLSKRSNADGSPKVIDVKPTAQLWSIEDPHDRLGGTPLGTTISEVGAEAANAVGLSKAQFLKTVVLPQGEFAAFLNAKNDDRREILERIFETSHYARLTQTLKDRSVEAQAQQASAKQALGEAIRRVESVAGPLLQEVSEFPASEGEGGSPDPSGLSDTAEPPDREGGPEPADLLELFDTTESADTPESAEASESSEATEPTGDATSPEATESTNPTEATAALVVDETTEASLIIEWTDRVRAAARLARERAIATATQAEVDAQAAATALTEARQRNDNRQTLRQARDRQRQLADREPELAAIRTQIKLAQTVVPVVALNAASDAAATRVEAAQEAHARAAQLVLAEPTEADVDPADPQAALLTLSTLLGQLRPLSEREQALTAQRSEIAALRVTLEQDVEKLSALQATAESLRNELAALDQAAQPQALQAAQDAWQEAQTRVTAAENVLQTARARLAEYAKLVAAQQEFEPLRLRAEQAGSNYSSMHRRWIAEMAGRLATELAEDQPCMVCGSLEHPVPATLAQDAIDDDALNDARAELDSANAELSARHALIESITERLRELTEQAGDERSPDDAVTIAQETLSAAVDTAAQGKASVDGLVASIEERSGKQKLFDAANSEVAPLEASVTKRGDDLTREQLAVDTAAAELDAARNGHASVTVRVASLEQQIERVAALAQASNELNAARDNATQRAHESHESAVAAGFASVAEATAHAIDATALIALTERVSAHDAAVAEVNQLLARPEYVDLDPTTPEDTAALETTASEAKAKADQTRREEGQATQTSEQVNDAAAEVVTALAERESVSPAAQTAVRLANIAGGLGPDNPKRISLTSFVLMEYFRDVVEAANDRLGEISAGRYQLEPHDEQKDGRKSAGLGLRITDLQTGQQRETGTMSGGEKFYTSLSLALGLADVVQQGAGATRLDTLFIDEGFGSLDTHTLDLVMNALTKLSSSGRAVGIISHVDEIKSRIAERITMVPQRDGTSEISVQC